MLIVLSEDTILYVKGVLQDVVASARRYSHDRLGVAPGILDELVCHRCRRLVHRVRSFCPALVHVLGDRSRDLG